MSRKEEKTREENIKDFYHEKSERPLKQKEDKVFHEEKDKKERNQNVIKN